MEYPKFAETSKTDMQLRKKIQELLTNILIEERKVSDQSQIENIIEEVKNMCESKPMIYTKVELYSNSNKRLQFLAEKLYEKYFKAAK